MLETTRLLIRKLTPEDLPWLIEMRAPARKPKVPLPEQHQPKPGVEAEIKPRPAYEAPQYKGSEKLKDKVAIVTGGDSGIARRRHQRRSVLTA